MPELSCEVEPLGTRLLVRVTGELCLSTVPKLRSAVLKCLVEKPDAVVVDLTGTTVSGPTSLSVLPAVSQQSAFWRDVPLLVVIPDARLARSLSGAHSRVTVVSSVEQALTAPLRRPTRSVTELLLPASGAARRARQIVADACAGWQIPRLAGPAGVVAGELVTNAVEHAGTMADLRLTLGRRYLMISVRDGSAEPPRPPRGMSADPSASRGLLLVESFSARWGSMPVEGGKVVWAAMRPQP